MCAHQPMTRVAEAVLTEARRRALPVARAAGWVAHALEEYARAAPIRPRGVYTGLAPSP